MLYEETCFEVAHIYAVLEYFHALLPARVPAASLKFYILDISSIPFHIGLRPLRTTIFPVNSGFSGGFLNKRSSPTMLRIIMSHFITVFYSVHGFELSESRCIVQHKLEHTKPPLYINSSRFLRLWKYIFRVVDRIYNSPYNYRIIWISTITQPELLVMSHTINPVLIR